MNTLLLKDNPQDIKTAAAILKRGGLVGIPTETVYGLAANALNGTAAANIFAAKGRPADNPLIVHICDFEDLQRFELVSEIPPKAIQLANAFWPGPLTIIMPKGKSIPDAVSAGLSTVAVRCPSHETARRLLACTDLPLAAPSANLSGSPSPTTAQHVLNDLNHKIDAVLDGGACAVGLESTVLTLAEETPRLLRPGGVTLEQMEEIIGSIEVDSAVLHKLADNAAAASPGMKYKHYAPKANVVLLKGSDKAYIRFVNRHASGRTAALCYAEDTKHLRVTCFSLGKQNDEKQHAHYLFKALRAIDLHPEIQTVYARCPKAEGIGMAVYNRLIRAAGFEVKELEEL